MNFNLKIAVTLITIFITTTALYAGGFAINDTRSARATGMGGAVIANRAEPASIATNPALITQLEGTEVQIGFSTISISAETTVGGDTRRTESNTFFIPNAYITGRLNENVYWGLGLFSRFGLGVTYQNHETWLGSMLGYSALLETFSINPTIAVRVTDELSLATGLEIMQLSFNQKKSFAPGIGLELDGSSIAWGGNFGAFYNPLWARNWAAGLTYRTKVNHNVRGTLNANPFTGLPSGGVTAPLTLPDSLTFGIAHFPTDRIIIEANVTGTFWSSYQTLLVNFNDNPGSPLFERKNYRDAVRFSLGAEYILSQHWDIRAGYTFDQSPINSRYMDTMVPAHDRNIFSIGLGFINENWAIDLAYAFYKMSNLSGTTEELAMVGGRLPISYRNSSSHVISLSARYRF